MLMQFDEQNGNLLTVEVVDLHCICKLDYRTAQKLRLFEKLFF